VELQSFFPFLDDQEFSSLTEHMTSWQSKANEALLAQAKAAVAGNPPGAYALYQMAWVSGSSPHEKLRALLGMAYCEKLLGRKERVAELSRMALQMLALVSGERAKFFEYIYLLLSSNGVPDCRAYEPTVALLRKVSLQHHAKYGAKGSEFTDESWSKGAQIANQCVFFEETKLPWLKKWLSNQNEISISHLMALPGATDALEKVNRMLPARRFKRALLAGKFLLLIESNTRFVCHILDKKQTWTLVDDTDLGATEQIHQTYFSRSGKAFAYQKCQGHNGASICFSTWANPKKLTMELKGVYPQGGFWQSDENRFYYVDYKQRGDDPEFPYLAVLDPNTQEKEILFQASERDAVIHTIMPNEELGYVLFLQSVESPKKKTSLMFLDLKDQSRTPMTLSVSDLISVESFGEKSVWFVDYDREHPRGQLWQLKWPEFDDEKKRFAPRVESQVVIEKSEHTIRDLVITHQTIVLHVMAELNKSELHCLTLNGEFISKPKLPFDGLLADLGKGPSPNEVVFSLSSLQHPKELFILNIDSMLVRKLFPDDKHREYEIFTEVVGATAVDGRIVPITLTSKTKIEKNSSNVIILYAYGGHGISAFRGFDPLASAWLELGGVYAVAAVRGGGEQGPLEYHEAVRENKRVSINDFISAAEFLISENYTRSAKLGITGTSAGGMLTGSALAQRPDLFGAAVIINGMHDMAKFLGYEEDYGTPRNSRHLSARLLYSPLHHVHPADYPATLIIASTMDQTVPAWHSYKFHSALKKCQQADKPILLRTFECDHDMRTAYPYPGEKLAFFAHHLGLRNGD